MKKLICIKCGVYFKDRVDEGDRIGEKDLCMKCLLIWRTIKITINAISNNPNFNRDVHIRFEDVDIIKRTI